MAVILSAYCDDSGTHESSRVVAVGGVLAEPDVWDAFSVEWAALLKKWRIPYFRMSSFESKTGVCAGWSKRKSRNRLNKLLALFDKYRLVSFGCSVPKDLYEQIVSPIAKAHYGGPYGLAAQLCFASVANGFRDGLAALDATVAYFFERGAKGWGPIERTFNANVGNPRWFLETITQVDKAKVPAVQAADIVAYELAKELPRFLGWPGGPSQMRYPLDRIWENPNYCYCLGPEILRSMSNDIDKATIEIHARAIAEGRKFRRGQIIGKMTYGQRDRR